MAALQTLPKEVVRKHVGAIHIKNDSSCLQRKLYDVLLYNAYEELGDLSIHAHSIRVKELSRLVGFDSKNVGYLKESLVAMVTTPLEWNIFDERGKAEWGVSGALADADIVDGICTYSYSRQLRKKLFNPTVYANLDLEINRRFNTGPGIALYQNIVRYRNLLQTPVFDLPLLKALIGVDGNVSYEDFKILNRAVIKPAVKEINSVSDIVVTVEAKRQQRKVVGLKFHIEEQDQDSETVVVVDANSQAAAVDAEDVAQRLQDYYMLTPKQSATMLEKYPLDRVRLVMHYVEQQYQTGRIKKIAPYFLKVIAEGDLKSGQSAFDLEAQAATQAKQSAAEQVEIQEQLKIEFANERRSAIEQFISGLNQVERSALTEAFASDLSSRNKLVYTKYVNSGMNIENKMVAAEYGRYVESKMIQLKLLMPADKALASYLEARGK